MAARPRLKTRAGSGIWHDATRAACSSFPTILRAATMQKRRSGCSRSTLAGENGAHSKHSIKGRRSIVWQQSTSAENARSFHSLCFFSSGQKLHVYHYEHSMLYSHQILHDTCIGPAA